MTQRISITCFEPVQGHKSMQSVLWPWIKAMTMAGNKITVEARKETRSIKQNRVLWARLTDVSNQVEWYGKRLSQEDWKHVFSSSLAKLDVVPNLDGTGFVALGLSTSSMTRAQLQDLNELIMAFGSNRPTPVKWSIASLCGEVDHETGEMVGAA